MRTLILCGPGLGDVLQASPLIRRLGADADATITVACPPGTVEISRHLDGAGEILPLALCGPHPGFGEMARGWLELRRHRFEIAFVCSTAPLLRGALYLSGIARRLGPSGGATAVLLTHHIAARPGENRSSTWLRLADGIVPTPGAELPAMHIPDDVQRRADQLLLSSGVGDGRLVIALGPGTGVPAADGESPELWDPERYAHLGNQLNQRHGASVVLLGDPADHHRVERVQMDLMAPALNLCGEIDLLTTAAVLARCDLLVSADTPLLHLAAAVGTPTVGLFGTSDGRRRGAWGGEHRVVQALADRQPPGEERLQRIRVDDVLAAIEASI